MKKFWKLFIIFSLSLLSFFIFLGVGVFIYYSYGLPNIITLKDYYPKLITKIYDINGKQIGEFYKEYREIVPYDKIPDIVIKAFIASEDSKFFEHRGLDFEGILRAAIINLKTGHFSQGASTITQQVARTLLLTPEKKLSRKIKEAILSLKMENNLSKADILFLYLNQIYLGHGAYGIGAAAKLYFNKNVEDLDIAEAALLAGLPQAPSRWSPFANPKQAKIRQLYVLSRMVEEGYITPQQAQDAANEVLKLYKVKNINLEYAPFFVEFVRRYLTFKYGTKAVLEDGLKVFTTLDSTYQKWAKEAVVAGLKAVDKRQGFVGPIEHLNTPQEIKNFINEEKEKYYYSHKDYTLFPDPRKPLGVLKINGFVYIDKTNEKQAQLLPNMIKIDYKKGENYKAVILNVDDEKKQVVVNVLGKIGVIPWDGLAWAHPRKLSPKVYAPPLEKPSEILQKGDVVLVEYKGDNIFYLDQEPQVEGALLSFHVDDGSIKAMVGGYNYLRTQFNRTYQAKRQVGSTFKPIVYSAAIDKGYTVSSVIVDSPIVYKEDEDEEAWKPHNYSEKYYGDTTLRNALIHSRNVPTTKILEAIGVPYVVAYARKLGIVSPLQMDLSIGLGSASIRLWEIMKVFSVFASLGKRIIPNFLRKIEDRDGNVLFSINSLDDLKNIKDPVLEMDNIETEGNDVMFEPILSKDTSFIMTYLLKDVVLYGTARRLSDLPYPIAGKTGTSNNFADAWFIGFSSKTITGVWVGFDDNTKTLGRGETGAKAAIPIWRKYMEPVLAKEQPEDFEQPDNIVMVRVDVKTGLRVDRPRKGIRTVFEPFKIGTEPKPYSQAKIEESVDFLKQDF